MSARVLDGRSLAPALEEQLRGEVAALVAEGRRPGLGVLRGGDEASAAYARRLEALGERLGLPVALSVLDEDATTQDALAALAELTAREDVSGAIVQVPLPSGVDEPMVLAAIDPAKDADAVHPDNAAAVYAGIPGPVPATALAVMALLDGHGIELEGRDAVVIGRSTVTGKPIAHLLLDRHATVTISHSRTPDLGAHTRRADVVVAAAGRPGLLTGEMVSPGAVVVDVGTNFVDGALVGDVAYDAVADVAAAVSPVPGGVGVLTNLMLVRNVLELTRAPG
jgi:methylenetetrahydrofolate dehydrogenase (NADP+)/methenyltetrahydrofolate cyclohydrolase